MSATSSTGETPVGLAMARECGGCGSPGRRGSARSLTQRRALGLVAGGAEDLQVLGRVRAAERVRDDVVVLDVEVRAALDAAAAVALEDGEPHLARDRSASPLGGLAGERRVGAVERAPVAPLALADQREHVV